MIIKGKRELKKKFNPEEEFIKLMKLGNDQFLNIDIGNRVFMYTIENKDDNDVIKIFNKLKVLNNETTYSLIIRYYVKKNISLAIKVLNDMVQNNIQIKKRTLIPIFNKLCESKKVDEVYQFYKKWIKKKIKLEEEDYECILPLVLNNNYNKILKSFLKSMKRNLQIINSKLSKIIITNSKNNGLTIDHCHVEKDGLCNNIKLKSVDLSKSEKNTLLTNIENIYAKEKNKSNLETYKDFLKKNKEIDVLMDGANILFNTDRKIGINGYHRINAIYLYLKKNNHTPLIILHQRHFDYLSKFGMSKDEIEEVKGLYKSWDNDVYLTPYKMNDDWFFIYGSIYKDKCKVVTNDQLRDHIFKISEHDLYQDILKKWIERRVINYKFKFNDYKNLNTLKLIFPNKFSVRIQRIDDIWYIPESKNKWLVLRIN